MKKVVRLTESDLIRIVKRVIKEQSNSGKSVTEKGLNTVLNKVAKYEGDLKTLKPICDFCKSSGVYKQSNTDSLISMVSDAVSGLDNPLNIMGGGSISEVAKIIRTKSKSADETCALIKYYDVDGEDFYEAIYDDSITKINTAQPANNLIEAIKHTSNFYSL